MAYNEIEARLVALETLIVELAADLPAGQLMAARDRIKAGLDALGGVPGDDFEGVVRKQALQHLDDAIRRHDEFTEGRIVRPRDG